VAGAGQVGGARNAGRCVAGAAQRSAGGSAQTALAAAKAAPQVFPRAVPKVQPAAKCVCRSAAPGSGPGAARAAKAARTVFGAKPSPLRSAGTSMAAQARSSGAPARVCTGAATQARGQFQKAVAGTVGGSSKISQAQGASALVKARQGTGVFPRSPVGGVVMPCPLSQAPVSAKPCGIAELRCQCGHGRKPGPGRVLQIVADTTRTEQVGVESYDVDGRTVSKPDRPIHKELKKDFGDMPEVTFTRKWEGKDAIEVEVRSVDGQQSGRRQTCLIQSAGSPHDSEWRNGGKGKYDVLSPDTQDDHPINASPQVCYVFGRGCDDITQGYTIESFPNLYRTGEIELFEFTKWADGVNKSLGRLTKDVFSYTPLGVEVKVDGPKGKFQAEWGWLEEESTWRAYFNREVTIELDPVFGFTVSLKFSLMKLAATLAGLPPPAATLLAEHLADILFGLEAAFSFGISGSASNRRYSNGEEKNSGSVKGTGEGSLTGTLTAHLGSDYVVSATAQAGGITKITGTGEAEFESEGLFGKATVEIEPLTLFVKIELKAFFFFEKEEKREWKIFDTWTLLKTDRMKLLPQSQGAPGIAGTV